MKQPITKKKPKTLEDLYRYVAKRRLCNEYPEGVAIDASGNIWVEDYINDALFEFSSSGVFANQNKTPSSGNDQF